MIVARWLALLGGVLWLSLASAGAQQIAFPADGNGQITFVMPSHNVECTYTPAGGTAVYKPAGGGPELSCDRRAPKYIRLVMTPASVTRYDDVGDQGCCGTGNPFPYGSQWSKGPFICDSAETGLVCRRSDGRGFAVSRERIEFFDPEDHRSAISSQPSAFTVTRSPLSTSTVVVSASTIAGPLKVWPGSRSSSA